MRARFFCLFIIECLFLVLSGCGPAFVAGTTGGFLAVHDRRTLGTLIDDTTLELKALQAISKDKILHRKSHITAISYNNVILLVGQTPTQAYKVKAENLVKRLSRVRYIYNEITISKPTGSKQRTLDTWITTQVKARMATHQLDPTRVKITTENNVVYLMGLVNRWEAANATRIAQEVRGVKKVMKIFEYI